MFYLFCDLNETVVEALGRFSLQLIKLGNFKVFCGRVSSRNRELNAIQFNAIGCGFKCLIYKITITYKFYNYWIFDCMYIFNKKLRIHG